MTRLSSETLDASWGSAADARRLADAQAENDRLMIATDHKRASRVADREWFVVWAAGIFIALAVYSLFLFCQWVAG